MSQISQAVEQRQQQPTIATFIGSLTPEIQRALPNSGVSADRIARLALTEVRKNPKLAEATPASFAGALLKAAALGLEPGVNEEAYLVPYKDKRTGRLEVQLIVGYQGFVKLYHQHPLAESISAHAVFEGDDFDFGYGTDRFIRHRPKLGASKGRKVIAYYATYRLKSGASDFVVLSPEDVQELRRGKVGSSGDIPDPQHWLERKTALRQLMKTAPKSTQLAAAIKADERTGSDLYLESRVELPEIESQPHVDVQTGEVLEVETDEAGR